MKSIGIIGKTGRMGRILSETIEKHACFKNSIGFSRSQNPHRSMQEVFEKNDYVVDFSKPDLLVDILKTANITPKPLVLCTTGWTWEEFRPLIDTLAKKIPIVIAPNTSVGAYVHRHLVSQLAKILGSEYDIDITDKHHRNKIDSPSGTAVSLLEAIQQTKKEHYDLTYRTYPVGKGPRPEHFIGLQVARTGNIAGDHEVSFTSSEEFISVRHVAFDRSLFAKGALRIVEWLDAQKPDPGVYTMQNVLNLV